MNVNDIRNKVLEFFTSNKKNISTALLISDVNNLISEITGKIVNAEYGVELELVSYVRRHMKEKYNYSEEENGETKAHFSALISDWISNSVDENSSSYDKATVSETFRHFHNEMKTGLWERLRDLYMRNVSQLKKTINQTLTESSNIDSETVIDSTIPKKYNKPLIETKPYKGNNYKGNGNTKR